MVRYADLEPIPMADAPLALRVACGAGNASWDRL